MTDQCVRRGKNCGDDSTRPSSRELGGKMFQRKKSCMSPSQTMADLWDGAAMCQCFRINVEFCRRSYERILYVRAFQIAENLFTTSQERIFAPVVKLTDVMFVTRNVEDSIKIVHDVRGKNI